MAAPEGNQYWKLAHNWKKPVKLKPEEILPKAIDYLTWCTSNPLIEEKAFGTGYMAKMNKIRAATIQGFCFYCNMSIQTWYEYEKQEAYSEIITRVKSMFFSQKFEGAAAGLLDGNIIARELGLKEHIEQKTTEIKKFDITKLSDEELRLIDELQRKGGVVPEES